MIDTTIAVETFLWTTSIVIFVGFILYTTLWLGRQSTLAVKGVRLPPGPNPRLITGNLQQLPKSDHWLEFTSWAKTYGPVTYFRVFHSKTIILNSLKAAADLLDSRSSIYSDRPIMWMAGELAGQKSMIFMTRFSNPSFKSLRRLLQDGLNARASRTYRPIQMREVQVLLQGLMDYPEAFFTHIRRNAVAVILKVAYGYQVESNGDEFVGAVDQGLKRNAELNAPGKYWVEFFPFCKFVPAWMPGAGFKKVAHETGKSWAQVNQAPFEWSRKQIATGDFVESFTSRHLLSDVGNDEGQAYDNVKWAAASLYVGGADTTVSALTSFFLAMMMHPEVQKKAQADIDKIAPNRLPTFDDYDALPYIRAIIKEVLRWAPVVPLGLFHRVMEDDIYEEYFIPKGSKIIANVWAMAHDKEMYPDPSRFDPSRHLGNSPQQDPTKFAFGFGRRVCPGAHFAEMSLFFSISSILAVFDISKPLDSNGLPEEPVIAWSTGVIRHLKPFRCHIKPRSQEHVAYLG
ncbi:Cytochrome P450 monooxygenase 208 [Psilocybe cubensis]|uniref:Cytochrome P450 n=2 Tax=Psilocybe cubensis TaxID=181762 RepID=A0A8H7XXM9_PSICU|nr:Cytochrome P450 monooxygenase 208 [Psilocybe cubensis]KAH9482218.1 Cytochrome P450 monooxygenase 208 [Psilocybe cubensis]